MPSAQLPFQILYLVIAIFCLGIIYSVGHDFLQRYRIHAWSKVSIAARKARLNNRLADARRLLQQAVTLSHRLKRHWMIRAITLGEAADLFSAEGKLQQAERYRRRALTIREKFDGARAPETAIAASNSAKVLDDSGKHHEAEPLHRNAVQFLQQIAEAESFYKRALAIREATLPMDHPYRARLLEDYARLLGVIGRAAEASQCAAQEHEARETHAANESVA